MNFKQEDFDVIYDLFQQYVGTIEVTDNCIKISNNNLIFDPFTNTEHRIPCSVNAHILGKNYPFGYGGDESTYRIIGGCSGPCDDIDELINDLKYCLNRYKFEQKSYTQLSLFDF